MQCQKIVATSEEVRCYFIDFYLFSNQKTNFNDMYCIPNLIPIWQSKLQLRWLSH